MDDYLSKLATETVNENTKNIDMCTTREILQLINNEDKTIASMVEKEIAEIEVAVEILYNSLKNGGKMVYLGAGTSGRLGVLDASECPPTFSTDKDQVQGYIAGGDTALRNALEGCEDSEELGKQQVIDAKITDKDVVIGITASGSCAYVIGGLKEAKKIGAKTIGVVNNKNSKLESHCEVCISVEVGPEVVIGSTRMKAGTSQKMVLNMLTTSTMIKLGKVYGNMMVDLKASNRKLNERATRIITAITEVSEDTAKEYLEKADKNTKLAIMMILTGLAKEEAIRVLELNQGYLKKALEKK